MRLFLIHTVHVIQDVTSLYTALCVMGPFSRVLVSRLVNIDVIPVHCTMRHGSLQQGPGLQVSKHRRRPCTLHYASWVPSVGSWSPG